MTDSKKPEKKRSRNRELKSLHVTTMPFVRFRIVNNCFGGFQLFERPAPKFFLLS